MKRNLLTLIAIILTGTFLLPAQGSFAQKNKGNKNVIKKTYNFAGFNKVDVGGVFDVVIEQAEKFSVVIETDENLHENMRLKLIGEKLIINSKGIKKFTKLKVYIEMPALNELSAHGASEVKIPEIFKQEEIAFDISGAADVMALVEAREIFAKTSGASSLKLTGSTENLYLESSGASDILAKGLQAGKAYAEASGASSIMLNATTELEVEESGAADINYVGNPKTYKIHKKDEVIVKTDEDIKVRSKWSEDEDRFTYNSMNISVDEKDDTTEIRVGNHKIVVDDDGNVVYSKHKKKPKFNGHWAGFDLGVNGYLTPDHDMSFAPEYDYLDLNMTKSIKVGINLFEQNVSLSRNQKWGLVTGIGWEINNYRFKDNVSLVPDSSVIKGYFNDGVSMKKSKLVVNYVEVPVLLEFQTNGKSKNNSFHLAAGMVFGLRFASHTKQYYNETNKEYQWLEIDPKTGKKVPTNPPTKWMSPGTKKSKVRDDFYLNPFKADATVRIGWGWINLFGTYSVTTLFRKDKGPELYPFSVGLTLVGW